MIFDLVKSQQEERDWHRNKIVKQAANLPPSVTLREFAGPIRHQGEAGFCHSFAGTAMRNLQERMENEKQKWDFAPLGLARCVKEKDGIDYTEGSTLKDVCKALCYDGVFDEVFYPYDRYVPGTLNFPEIEYKEKPNTYRTENYMRLDDLQDVKESMAKGQPVLVGMTCGSGFSDPVDGCIGLPLGEMIIGNHAVLAVGYDDRKKAVIKGKEYEGFVLCQNSWGADYGDNGFFWLPYEYFEFVTKDFGMSFIFDLYTTIDIMNEELQGDMLEIYLGDEIAFDNGKAVALEQPAVVDGKTGRTLIPLRFFGEALDLEVEWLHSSRSIILKGKGHEIEMTVGCEWAKVDGVARKMEQPPVIDRRTERTLAPLRFVAETFGKTVLWDGRRRKIIVLK